MKHIPNALDSLTGIPQAQAPTDKPPLTYDETLALIEVRLIELGFDDRVPYNYRTISRYLAHIVKRTTKRGIWIDGAVGTGKTLAMTILCKQLNKIRHGGKIVTARRISMDVSKLGISEVLDKFISKTYDGLTTGLRGDLIVDDIGSESASSHYGIKSWPVIDLVAERYELWQATGQRMHITTNIPETVPGTDAGGLLERYGPRTVSRLHEMCHHVSFTGSDRRRDQQTATSGR